MYNYIKYIILYHLFLFYSTDSGSSVPGGRSSVRVAASASTSSSSSTNSAAYPTLQPLSLSEIYEYTNWFRTVRPLRLLCDVCTIQSSPGVVLSASTFVHNNMTLLRSNLPFQSTVASLLSDSLLSFTELIQEAEAAHQRRTETLTNRRIIRINKAVKLLIASFRAYSTLYNETLTTTTKGEVNSYPTNHPSTDNNTITENKDRTDLENQQLTYLNERLVHTFLKFRNEFPSLLKEYALQAEESSNLFANVWNGLTAVSTYSNRVQEYKEKIQQYGTVTGKYLRQSKDYLATLDISSVSINELLRTWFDGDENSFFYSSESTVNVHSLYQQVNKILSLPEISVLMAIGYGFEFMNEDIQYCDQTIGNDNILIMKIAQRIFLSETVSSNECTTREFIKTYLVQVTEKLENMGVQLFTLWKRILQPYAFSSLPRIMKKAILSDFYQMDAEFTIALGEAYYQTKLSSPRDYLVTNDASIIINDRFRTKLVQDILNEALKFYRTLLRYSHTLTFDKSDAFVQELLKDLPVALDIKDHLINFPLIFTSLSTKSMKKTITYLRNISTILSSRAGGVTPIIWREYTCQGTYPKYNQDSFIAVTKGFAHIFQTLADILDWIEGQAQTIMDMDNSLQTISIQYNGDTAGDTKPPLSTENSFVTQSFQRYVPLIYEFIQGFVTIISNTIAME